MQAAEASIMLADLKLAINPCLAKQTQSQLLQILPLVLGEGSRALQARLHRSLAGYEMLCWREALGRKSACSLRSELDLSPQKGYFVAGGLSPIVHTRKSEMLMTLLPTDRVLEHLSAATEKYEAQEDWQHAAEASYQAALVSATAGLTSRRNRAAAAFQRLTTLAQEVV